MPNRRFSVEDSLGGLAEAGKGLAHSARLRLLAMLASGELCVCQMTSVLELAPSTVSQHLSVLSRGGLVTDRKVGKLVFYRLASDAATVRLLSSVLDRLEHDPRVRADREIVERLRQVPVEVLCAADLDLHAIGVREDPPTDPDSPRLEAPK